MKYASALLALAATVTAVPTGSGNCNNAPNIYCCSGGLLNLCLLNILGCTGSSYCCETTHESPTFSLIDLSCTKIL
ncbi:hypothetical protein E4U42_004858 [Claviceps africana]|uniref:Hydrophobin 3 n=1 Tax=Claviceps africana TaxID=83212 RepID=A0A8K0J6T0_9HYPO|nr:hypothetical protein E4U42_004858 [Claviceps africana]